MTLVIGYAQAANSCEGVPAWTSATLPVGSDSYSVIAEPASRSAYRSSTAKMLQQEFADVLRQRNVQWQVKQLRGLVLKPGLPLLGFTLVGVEHLGK